MGYLIIYSIDLFKNTDSFINQTQLCLLGDVQQLSCDLFGTIFVDEIVFLKFKSLNINF